MILFLNELERAIDSSADIEQRAERTAERACYLARIGRIDEAKASLVEIRGAFPSGASARVSVWVMLAESHVMYFGSLSDQARDRANRSYEVSRALGLADLKQYSGVWLAHIELDRSNYAKAISLLLEALSSLNEFKAGILIRGALVLGDAYLLVGNRKASQEWYQVARSAALLAGDQVAIGAVMYNRGAFGLTWRSVQEVLGENPQTEDAQLIALELHSSAAFHHIARITALEHLSHLFRARAMLTEGRIEESLSLLLRLQSSVMSAEDRERKSPLIADIALCHALGGRYAEVLSLVESLSEKDVALLDSDDKVVFVGRLVRAIRHVGAWHDDHWLAAEMQKAKEQYAYEMALLSEALEAVNPDILVSARSVVASSVGAKQ